MPPAKKQLQKKSFKGGKVGSSDYAGVSGVSGVRRGYPAFPSNARNHPGGVQSSSTRPGGCGTGVKVLLYLLLIVAIIIVAFVVYKAFTLKKVDGKNTSGIERDTAAADRYRKYTVEKYEDEDVALGDDHEDKQYRLVYLHMNGCSYCRKFDPVWQKFKNDHANTLKKNHGVTLVSYESGQRQAAGFNVTGFPTVLFAEKNSDDVIDTFSSERTVQNLLSFVVKNANKVTV